MERDLPTTPPEPEVTEEELVDDDGLVEDGPIAKTPDDIDLVEDETPTPGPTSKPVPITPTVPAIDKEKLLTFVEDIIDTLTFKRVSLLALLVAVGLVMFSLYENRGKIFGSLTKSSPSVAIDQPVSSKWVLSPESKTSLETLAKTTSVALVIVSDVDLKKNRRVVRFYYLDDLTIRLEPAAMQALSLPLPVFDYDSKNTEQMVSVLSNEFRCDAYKTTVYFRHAPELADKFPTICRIAIPPFVGQFVGFLAVGIAGELSKNEIDSIRLEVSRIAVEIYLNDVMKKPVPVPQ